MIERRSLRRLWNDCDWKLKLSIWLWAIYAWCWGMAFAISWMVWK